MQNDNNVDNIVEGIKKQKSKKGAEEFLKSKLNPDQSKRLNQLLNDETAMRDLLSTPQAQELLKKFTKGENKE